MLHQVWRPESFQPDPRELAKAAPVRYNEAYWKLIRNPLSLPLGSRLADSHPQNKNLK